MKVSSWQLAVGSALVAFFLCCQEKKDVQSAFYHWKTEFNLSDFEKSYLDSLSVKKLYVKFFDVEWDANKKMPVPLALLEIRKLESWKDGKLEMVPCVFITNRTFQNISEDKIEWFCERVEEKLFELKPDNLIFREIQFDCDWTASTRERYFEFLQVFKKKMDASQPKVCATIRLHQFRDFETTGVPPVDRGMLMFYNTGDVESWNEENSILNLEVAEQYLVSGNQYSVPLDIALPIFSWGVLFREGAMIRLINNLNASDLQDTMRFRKIASNRFESIKNTYLDGYYLYKNDLIRTEAIDTTLLSKTTNLLTTRIKNRNLTLAFYHLDTATIKHFPHEFLEQLTQRFR